MLCKCSYPTPAAMRTSSGVGYWLSEFPALPRCCRLHALTPQSSVLLLKAARLGARTAHESKNANDLQRNMRHAQH